MLILQQIPKLTFQSTLPVKGATVLKVYNVSGTTFQSTLPVKGATTASAGGIAELDISIHAPREGSDVEHERT